MPLNTINASNQMTLDGIIDLNMATNENRPWRAQIRSKRTARAARRRGDVALCAVGAHTAAGPFTTKTCVQTVFVVFHRFQRENETHIRRKDMHLGRFVVPCVFLCGCESIRTPFVGLVEKWCVTFFSADFFFSFFLPRTVV
jgi:hypothetical protein